MRDLVEGQEIARAVLANEADAWDRFLQVYGPRFLNIAKWKCRNNSYIAAEESAEGLVSNFLSDRLLAPVMPKKEISGPSAAGEKREQLERRAEMKKITMFGPSAAGRLPLWPRLSLSFKNYLFDVARERRRGRNLQPPRGGDPPPDEESTDEPEAAAPDPREILKDVTSQVAEQIDSIRKTFAGRDSNLVPLGGLLLLSERLQLIKCVGESYLLDDGSLPEGIDVPAIVELLSSWTTAEEEQALPTRNLPLKSAWDELKVVVAPPDFKVSDNQVSAVLQTPPSTWAKWRARARRGVLERIGISSSRELFPHWPDSLFRGGHSR